MIERSEIIPIKRNENNKKKYTKKYRNALITLLEADEQDMDQLVPSTSVFSILLDIKLPNTSDKSVSIRELILPGDTVKK
jgi:hypothetical protein